MISEYGIHKQKRILISEQVDHVHDQFDIFGSPQIPGIDRIEGNSVVFPLLREGKDCICEVPLYVVLEHGMC